MYSINEIEKMYGIPASTLRYYEKKGLLPKINRDEGGRRKYTDQELERLQLVLALRNTGMSIDEIKNFVVLIKIGDDTLEERLNILLRQKDIIEKDMAQKFRYLEKINKKMAIYEARILKKNGGDIFI